MATSIPASPSAAPAAASPSPAPSAPATGGAGPAPSPAPRTEADFLAGAPGPTDALFSGEEPAEGETPAEGAEAAPVESPDAIFDEIEQTLPDDVRAAFKQRLDHYRTTEGRFKALTEERRQLAQAAQHNTQAGQGWMQLFGMAVQQMRAAGIDTSQLEQYAGGQVPDGAQAGEPAGEDGAGQGGFDYRTVASESINGVLSPEYWGKYSEALDVAERELEAARDLVEAQHPAGPAQLKAAQEKRRQVDQIHARYLAAAASYPTKVAYEDLSRRLAALEGGQTEEAASQQFQQAVFAALREHAHAADELGKPIWREGGKFPFYTADGKKLAPLGQQMIGQMAAFWEETGTDPADPKAFARAFHAVRGEMGIDVQQAAPQVAAGGRRGGGDPTLPGGASIPVAAVGRSPFQTPESRRLAILEQNRRGMRETG